MTETAPAADPEEVARFEALAAQWRDETGPFAPLHAFNPVRLGAIRDALVAHFRRDGDSLTPLRGLSLLDIGCGGGLVAEPMARMGARVTGIDPAERNVAAARVHARASGLDIDYRAAAAEELEGGAFDGAFDIVLALETVEHAADRDRFIAAAAARAAPGGLVFAATLNRTAEAFAKAIVGAEYILRWLPRGTHRWSKFVRPSELIAALAANGLRPAGAVGFAWRPFGRGWTVTRDLSVNYMVWAARPEQGRAGEREQAANGGGPGSRP